MAGRGQWVGRLREVRVLEHVPGETEKLGTSGLCWENKMSSVDLFHPSLKRHRYCGGVDMSVGGIQSENVTVRRMTKYNVEMSGAEKLFIWLCP